MGSKIKKTTVLVVDDDRDFLEETESALLSHGYDVFTAMTGEEAKRTAKKNKPRIVLIDKKLPDTDGQVLMKELKKISKDIGFIIITAYGDMDSAIEGLREGAVDYVSKPVNLDVIVNKIETFIKKEAEQQKHLEQIRQWVIVQNKKYKSLFQKANDGIVISDTKTGIIVDCNEVAVNLLGYAREELIGKNQIFLYPEDEREKYREKFENWVKTLSAVEEAAIQTKSGQKIPTAVSVSVVKLNGKSYVQSIYRDLSELRKKEIALRSSEEKYRDLLNAVPGIVYVTKMPGEHAIYVNRKIEEALGFSQGEWLTNKELWEKQIYPDDRKRVLDERTRAQENRKNFETTYRMIHRDGNTIKWFKDNAVVTKLKGENAVLVTGVMVDITDVKLRQEENEKLSRAVKDINESVLITEHNGIVVYCNCVANKMLGYEVRELVGRHISVVFSELNPPLLSTEIEKGVMEGKSWYGEIIAERKDGSSFPAQLRVDPMKDEDGRIKGAIEVMTDITEKRLLEDELRRRAQFLEQKVEERTKDLHLALEEIEKANRKLKKYDALKSEFVANVAHELINPLAVIRESMLNISERIAGETDKESKKVLEISKREIDRLAAFVNNMLDLSKIEMGTMPMTGAEIKIKPLLDEIKDYFANEFKNKNISFTSDIESAPEHIWGDASAIKEVFINIISNALKYTPPGKNISLKVYRMDNVMRIEVKDEGPGIPDAERERIFDKFHRIFAERAKGTGLGLSIAKEIVELHKGRIWVESEEGRGSTFIIILPIDARNIEKIESF